MAVAFTDWEGTCLAHHGIKGQKWGVRRFQNEDGTLTSAGKIHYGQSEGGSRRLSREYNRQTRKLSRMEKRTDVRLQARKAQQYADRAVIAGGVASALGLAALKNGSGVNWDYHKWNSNPLNKPSARKKRILGEGKGIHKEGTGLIEEALGGHTNAQSVYYQHPAFKQGSSTGGPTVLNKVQKKASLSTGTKLLLGGAAAAAGYAAYSSIRSKIAKDRTTLKGHQKAVNKYEQQYGKMVEKFMNTPYSELVREQKNKGRR